jgi:hypothetical protein
VRVTEAVEKAVQISGNPPRSSGTVTAGSSTRPYEADAIHPMR